MSSSLASVERRSEEASDVLVVRGELDLTSVQSLEDALAASLSSSVILDLSELDFIDSAGMRAIDRSHRRLAEEGRTLLIVAPEESRAGWTLRVAGFPSDFAMESMDLALLQAVRGTARQG